MRLSVIFVMIVPFIVGFVLSVIAATFAVEAIEDSSRRAVRDTLQENDMAWTAVDADGLQVYLAGTAPSEAKRFRALSIAGSGVESARIIDEMLVEDAEPPKPPKFSVEILRNTNGLSLLGLIPANTDREALLADVRRRAPGDRVADLLQTADYSFPPTWQSSLTYGLRALETMPRAKISIEPDHVTVVAMVESDQDKQNLETRLARSLPEGIGLTLKISAPRPVSAPFSLRYVLQNGNGRFDACYSDTESARDRILAAAGRSGLSQKANCVLALGVPSPKWGRAAELSIDALADLGGGSLTMSDADIVLVAAEGTPSSKFDEVIGRLETSLPDIFALQSILPKPEASNVVIAPELVATLSPEGQVQIRGKLDSEITRDTVDSFARAKFGSAVVDTAARVSDDLPKDWTVRVLAAIDALALLSNGSVVVESKNIQIKGQSGKPDITAQLSQVFTSKLGEAARFDIQVAYREELDPVASLPTPEECESSIAEVQSSKKITFEPGAAEIDASGAEIMDQIADILKECGKIRMEIGGHTDSQGREIMNLNLSQARAQTVLNELRTRRVLTSNITAKGYGESQPIAGNDSEEGREANRRIEFKVFRPETTEQQTTLEALEQTSDYNTTAAEDINNDEQN